MTHVQCAANDPVTPPPRRAPDADRLARVGASPGLPTPPPVALEVIQKASQPDCELEDIARVIARDAGLCDGVLRAVNSVMFGLQRPIESIDRAVHFLGLKSVRSLVLSLSLPTMRLQTSTDPRLCDWWTASVAGAIIARELAVKLGRRDAEDDMVSALLSDLGVFVLQQLFPAEYAPLLAHKPDVLAYRQCELEEGRLGLNHADVSAFILRRWRLPDDIVESIRHHHGPAAGPGHSREVVERSRLLYLAVRTAQLQIAPDSQPALLREVLGLACDGFGLSEADFLDFMEPLNRKIDEFGAVMRLDAGALAHYPTVVANATVELLQLPLDRATDAARAPSDDELLRWRRIAHRLRRDATRDRLTGAFNRAYFDEALAREHSRARRRTTALGLLVIDVDGFTAINDRLGRPFGDQVLREVAAELRRGVRADDVVARCGGDEFCVIAVDPSPEGVSAMANRVRHALAGLLVRHDGAMAAVTASVGGAVCLPQRGRTSAGELLAEAHRALAAARADGTARVRSSVGGEDLALLHEVKQRLFSTFLASRDAASPQEVRAALRAAPPSPVLIGRLARRLGWIKPRQLRRLLRDRHKNRRTFAESALALRCLSPAQVHTLLALQREPPEDLAGALV
ncbi:MAG TPA: GGDEF domain-containing protein, partial [Gemmataceae bacterium]|nr:GGDEF domain-containing protein [Gemmataceae bacterium]